MKNAQGNNTAACESEPFGEQPPCELGFRLVDAIADWAAIPASWIVLRIPVVVQCFVLLWFVSVATESPAIQERC